jgi:hypothetical protein
MKIILTFAVDDDPPTHVTETWIVSGGNIHPFAAKELLAAVLTGKPYDPKYVMAKVADGIYTATMGELVTTFTRT